MKHFILNSRCTILCKLIYEFKNIFSHLFYQLLTDAPFLSNSLLIVKPNPLATPVMITLLSLICIFFYITFFFLKKVEILIINKHKKSFDTFNFCIHFFYLLYTSMTLSLFLKDTILYFINYTL